LFQNSYEKVKILSNLVFNVSAEFEPQKYQHIKLDQIFDNQINRKKERKTRTNYKLLLTTLNTSLFYYFLTSIIHSIRLMIRKF